MARWNTDASQRGEFWRQLAFDLVFGTLAAVAIVSFAVLQLIDEMRIPHCLTASPLSVATLFAPCVATTAK
jgi:hypothetical protein